MGRKKVLTRAERTQLRTELADAETALQRTTELLADEPRTLRDGVEARERVSKAQSEFARVQDVAATLQQTSGLTQLLGEAEGQQARDLPRRFGERATQAGDRLASAADQFEAVDRTLAENRVDRAGESLARAGTELGAVKATKDSLEEDVATVKRNVDQAPESDWLEVITSLIPIEVIAGWTAIQAIIGVENPTLSPRLYWAVFAVVLVATFLHVRKDFRENADSESPEADSDSGARRPASASPNRRRPSFRTVARWSERVQLILAVGAFVVWVYYLEGPFATAGLHDSTLAAVLLPLYTLAGVQLVSEYTTILAGLEFRLRQVLSALV